MTNIWDTAIQLIRTGGEIIGPHILKYCFRFCERNDDRVSDVSIPALPSAQPESEDRISDAANPALRSARPESDDDAGPSTSTIPLKEANNADTETNQSVRRRRGRRNRLPSTDRMMEEISDENIMMTQGIRQRRRRETRRYQSHPYMQSYHVEVGGVKILIRHPPGATPVIIIQTAPPTNTC